MTKNLYIYINISIYTFSYRFNILRFFAHMDWKASFWSCISVSSLAGTIVICNVSFGIKISNIFTHKRNLARTGHFKSEREKWREKNAGQNPRVKRKHSFAIYNVSFCPYFDHLIYCYIFIIAICVRID